MEGGEHYGSQEDSKEGRKEDSEEGGEENHQEASVVFCVFNTKRKTKSHRFGEGILSSMVLKRTQLFLWSRTIFERLFRIYMHAAIFAREIALEDTLCAR